MYELVILGFLMRGPIHGYLVAKIINDMIGPFARLSNGRLYPLLAKLEADGLITAIDETSEPHSDRRPRPYQVTDAGRERFHQLMLDTTSNPGEYGRIFWHKLPFLDFLEPAERLGVLDHYLHFCRAHIFHITHEMEDLTRKAGQQGLMSASELEATHYAMAHIKEQWELDLRQASMWREREAARPTA